MTSVLQDLVNGVSLGCLYALYALSIAMIFGVARIVNFANGELMTVAAYGLLLTGFVGGFVGLALAVVVVVVLALLMERLAFRRIIDAPVPTLMVMSLGVSLLVQSILLIAFGSRPRALTFGAGLGEPVRIGSLSVPALDLVTIAVVVGLGGALLLTLQRTSAGIQLRAAAEDFQMARLVGVRANRVVALSFVLSGTLAAAAGVILGMKVGTASYTLGSQPVILGFIATVIGGLGSIVGAAAGGFLLGAATVLAQVVLPPSVNAFRDAFVFAAVVVLLLVRPQGLFVAFGRKERA